MSAKPFPLLTVMVMVYINDNIINLDIAESLCFLSEQRKMQMHLFRNDIDKKLCVAAYILLKQGLQEEYGITDNPVFDYSETGKPYISGYPDIHFNFSHCKQAAICVIDRKPVGVDIEEICHYGDDVRRFVLSDDEWCRVNGAADSEVEFMKYWTMKESYLKLTGEGLRDDLKTVFPNEAKYTTVLNSERRYIYSICQW